jgi:(p)ppGpp synthase/HD superfamily hydrolase
MAKKAKAQKTHPDATQLTARFDEAVTFAREVHGAQVSKGTSIPYLAHLLGVASIVLEMNGSEDEAIAALLHDAVEDGGGEPIEIAIREQFGETVTRIVIACTDSGAKPKPPWRARKLEFLNSVPGKQRDELLVALADKLHNVRRVLTDYRAIGDEIWPRFKEGREGQLWYYQELVDAFESRADDFGPAAEPKLGELRRTVNELIGEIAAD